MKTESRRLLYCRWLALPLVGLALLMARPAVAAPFNYTWRIESLARVDAETVELRDNDNRILKRIDVQQAVYLYSVMQAIEKVSELRSELLITDGNQPNAFATRGLMDIELEGDATDNTTAGGEASMRGSVVNSMAARGEGKNTVEVNIIGINFAMLDLLGLDVHMAAALIGHELGHIKLNHAADNKSRGRPDIRTAANTRYSRDNEREADYLGAIWAVEAGYDPAGAVRLQELVYKKTKNLPSGFSGTHPTSIERIAKLKSLARRLAR